MFYRKPGHRQKRLLACQKGDVGHSQPTLVPEKHTRSFEGWKDGGELPRV